MPGGLSAQLLSCPFPPGSSPPAPMGACPHSGARGVCPPCLAVSNGPDPPWWLLAAQHQGLSPEKATGSLVCPPSVLKELAPEAPPGVTNTWPAIVSVLPQIDTSVSVCGTSGCHNRELLAGVAVASSNSHPRERPGWDRKERGEKNLIQRLHTFIPRTMEKPSVS